MSNHYDSLMEEKEHERQYEVDAIELEQESIGENFIEFMESTRQGTSYLEYLERVDDELVSKIAVLIFEDTYK